MSTPSGKRDDKQDVPSSIEKVEEAQKEHNGKLEEHGKDIHELKQGVKGLSELPATVDKHSEQIEELQDRHAAHEKEIENIKAAVKTPDSKVVIPEKSADKVGESNVEVNSVDSVSKGKGKEVVKEKGIDNQLVVKPDPSKEDNAKSTSDKGVQFPAKQDNPPVAKVKLAPSSPEREELKKNEAPKVDDHFETKKGGDVDRPVNTNAESSIASKTPGKVSDAQSKQAVKPPKDDNEQSPKHPMDPSKNQKQTSQTPKAPDQVAEAHKTEGISPEISPVEAKKDDPAKKAGGPSKQVQPAPPKPQMPKVSEPMEHQVAVAEVPSKSSKESPKKEQSGPSDHVKQKSAKDGDTTKNMEDNKAESRQDLMEKSPVAPVVGKVTPPEAKPVPKDITEAAKAVKPVQHNDKINDRTEADDPNKPGDKPVQTADPQQSQEFITKSADKHDVDQDKVQKVDRKAAVEHNIDIKKLSETQNIHSEKIADHDGQLNHHSTSIKEVKEKNSKHEEKLQQLAKQQPTISQHTEQIGKLTDKTDEHGEKVAGHDVHIDYHKDDLKLLKEAHERQATTLASHSVEIHHNTEKLKELDHIRGDVDEMGGNIIHHETELKHHEDDLKELTAGQKYLERDGRKLAVHDQLFKSLQDSVNNDKEIIATHDEKLESIVDLLRGGEANIPQEMAKYKGLLTDVATAGLQQHTEIEDLKRAQFRQTDQIQTLKEKTKKIERIGQTTHAAVQSNNKALEIGLVASGLGLFIAGITGLVLFLKGKRGSAKKSVTEKEVDAGGDEGPEDVDKTAPNGDGTETVPNEDQGRNNGRPRRRPLRNGAARRHARAWTPENEFNFLF
jgi:hypothetical protein